LRIATSQGNEIHLVFGGVTVRLRAKDEEEKWIKTLEFWKKPGAPPLPDTEGSSPPVSDTNAEVEEPEGDGQTPSAGQRRTRI